MSGILRRAVGGDKGPALDAEALQAVPSRDGPRLAIFVAGPGDGRFDEEAARSPVAEQFLPIEGVLGPGRPRA